AAGQDVGGAGAIMMLIVELVDDELDIEPIHRLLDLPAGVDVRARLSDAFDLVDAGPYAPDRIHPLLDRMAQQHAPGIVEPDGLTLAIPNTERRAAALADENPAVASTDAAVVEALAMPLLPEATWRYWHDAETVAAQVDKGAASAAILCS